MKSKFANAVAGGEGSVRGPYASCGLTVLSGNTMPKFQKGKGQKNNRKRDRALKNALAREKREMKSMAKRESRSYERSGEEFGWVGY